MSFVRVRRATWRRPLAVTAAYTALTALITWPQPLVLATRATEHQDIYFNLWRLRWIAHALATAPGELFQGNIFYGARNTLALSDAILLQGVLGAPLFWSGLPPVLVHNLLLLGAIVASAVGTFVLAEHLTGSRVGAFAAGMVFAFAPYRIDHIMHMELQWAMWIPWSFWALQRTLETRRLAFGLLTGAFMALQMLSCIYYGIFLALLLPIVAVVQLLAQPAREVPRVIGALLLGAAVLAGVAALYGQPYVVNSTRVGVRSTSETTMFSARPRDYLAATESNLLYGEPRRGRPERRLFPGIVPLLVALVGLLLIVPVPAWTVAYAIGGLAAFELSLGMYGLIYPDLYDHLTLLRGLRAPARASMLCLMFLGVLAARGCAALEAELPAKARRLVALILPALLLEYWVAPLPLVSYANSPPPLYAYLAAQPPGVVAEFPLPKEDELPGRGPAYAYMSTFHWKPILNGYSGYYPPSYINHLRGLGDFPDRAAIDRLRRTGVTYVIVHADAYEPGEFKEILETLTKEGLVGAGIYPDGWNRGAILRLPAGP